MDQTRLEKLAGDLIVAILAVQNFSIERAFGLLQGLEAHGLLDLQLLRGLNEGEVRGRLLAAGFNRGEFFNQTFAKRIHSVAQSVGSDGLRELLRLEEAGDVKGVERYLLSLWGIGPAVVWNYKVLRSLKDKPENPPTS